jgi:hypothetical protein
MNVLLFGATGMVGQGVLRECLRSVPRTSVLGYFQGFQVAPPGPDIRASVQPSNNALQQTGDRSGIHVRIVLVLSAHSPAEAVGLRPHAGVN